VRGRRERLTASDIVGAWAVIPTPATDNASDWRSEDTIDLAEAARAVEGLIDAGIDGIITLGTLGECATLSWEEKRGYIAAITEVVRGRIPFFCGTTSLGTRETIRQTKAALDIGVDGTMVGPPMWCEVDVPEAVRFYRDLAEACPAAAICIYANPSAFKFSFPRPFWAQVAQIPQVVMAKYLSIENLMADLDNSKGRVKLLPMQRNYYAAARTAPEQCNAFWTSTASCGPAPVIRLRDAVVQAIKTGDWVRAKEITDAMTAAGTTFMPRGDHREFEKFNIALEKMRTDAAGWMKAGPCRPPYHVVPEPYLEGAREAGRRWAKLHAELSKKAAPERV
jgi:trans-o-hydroxybenzylidenepyruvate hydratase-aldolase